MFYMHAAVSLLNLENLYLKDDERFIHNTFFNKDHVSVSIMLNLFEDVHGIMLYKYAYSYKANDIYIYYALKESLN